MKNKYYLHSVNSVEYFSENYQNGENLSKHFSEKYQYGFFSEISIL